MKKFRNIHAQPLPAPTAEAQTITPEAPALPRLREVTNDPVTEFKNRPGKTRPLPDEIVALILFRQERREVSRDGITLNGVQYWSENSITIATKADTKERVLITYNRHEPNVIHVLTSDGEYVESIPAKQLVPWFDPEKTREELAAVRRDHARTTERLVQLHAADSLETLARSKANAARMHHVVHTFERPQEMPQPPAESNRLSSAQLIQHAEAEANRVAENVKSRRKVNVAREILKADRAPEETVNPHDWL